MDSIDLKRHEDGVVILNNLWFFAVPPGKILNSGFR
jgi:hypothetical protein